MESKVVQHLYQTFKNAIITENEPDRLISKVQDFGFFCWSHYPGNYTDQEIEDKLAPAMLPALDPLPKISDNHYIYIATRLFEVGGHSRCILHFIDNFTEATHTVILLDQKKSLPNNLHQFFSASNTSVIKLKAAQHAGKAEALRNEIKRLLPSKIFLFTHPNDLIPLMAFGLFHPCEINLYNHADHTFWIGGKWIDRVIDFRSTGVSVTRQSRNINRSDLLLLPVNYTYQQVSKSTAKNLIGIPPGQRIVGTLTNLSKIQVEKNEESFADFIIARAKENVSVLFMIIGLSEAEFCNLLSIRQNLPANIRCLGIVPDPDAYYQAFDFFLEPFPIASPLGMLEACKYGAIPIFSPHACYLSGSFHAFHHSIMHLCKYTHSMEELLQQFNEAIIMSDLQMENQSHAISSLIAQHHRGDGWAACLDNQALLQKDIALSPTVDPLWEMQYFQRYVKKTQDELFQYLFQLKALVNKKMLLSFFFGKNRIFRFTNLSLKSYKMLMWKLAKG